MRVIADDDRMTVFFPGLIQKGNGRIPVVQWIGVCQFDLVSEQTGIAQRGNRFA